MKTILIIMTALIVFASCNKEEEEVTTPPTKPTTMYLFYHIDANNNEQFKYKTPQGLVTSVVYQNTTGWDTTMIVSTSFKPYMQSFVEDYCDIYFETSYDERRTDKIDFQRYTAIHENGIIEIGEK